MLNPTPILLGGAPEGFDARLLSRELARGVPVIHVARDDKRMEAMRAALGLSLRPTWRC
jgi:transcription-repair coupling factor (superfamily II helicase)